MSIIVEHEKRKREILDSALDVFLEEGYSGASYQKIADRCGIARTILYTYFKNKQEIFRYTVKQVTEALEKEFEPIVNDAAIDPANKISLIGRSVVSKCVQERKLFSVIMEYLLDSRRSRSSPEQLVRRRVIKLRMAIARILVEGIKAGKIRKVNVRGIDEAFYAIIESAIVKLVVMKRETIPEVLEAMDALAQSLRAEPS